MSRVDNDFGRFRPDGDYDAADEFDQVTMVDLQKTVDEIKVAFDRYKAAYVRVYGQEALDEKLREVAEDIKHDNEEWEKTEEVSGTRST